MKITNIGYGSTMELWDLEENTENLSCIFDTFTILKYFFLYVELFMFRYMFRLHVFLSRYRTCDNIFIT